ncbi:MAG: tRNA (adenosine(37)-N6)-dimethylallyltransferase MiaA [Alphaproteobacteria bacterium]
MVIVAGPTASGKSAAALRIAEVFGGTVINADSMQVYAGLPVLTAQPSAADLARVPHRLYGVRDPAAPWSVADWRTAAVAEIRACHAAGRLPVVTGGTGLYLEALRHGLSPVPPVPDAVRAAARALQAEIGTAALHARLAAADPDGAARLRPSDPQRVVRAWEVLQATGRPLRSWQAMREATEVGWHFAQIVMLPPRAVLYPACDARFSAMLAQGALAEVAALAALRLDPALPAMKAVGVPELLAHLAGTATLDEAAARARQATRRYAKRQYTWFRHRMPEAHRLDAQYSESLEAEIFTIIRHCC